MKVSIVTISLNQAPYLERSMRSILDQNHTDIEYIVVDPGSTDGSRAIIDRYRGRIAHTILEPDNGPVDGLNGGFARASGDICGYINSDDALLPGAVRHVITAFERNPAADLIYGHGCYVDEGDRVLRRFRSTPFYLRGCPYGSINIMQQATFFRRRAFRDVGGFNRDNRTCWDFELCVDFALRGKRLVRVNDYLGLFRIHAGSISGSGRADDLWRRDMRRIAQKITGRRTSPVRPVLRMMARFEKWARDPISFFVRLGDALAGRRVFDRPLPRF